MSKRLTQKMRDGDFKFRKSEHKVANWILDNAHEVPSLNITTIAEKVGVSEPTIVRFCRAAECKGYQEFKIRLAEDLALGEFSEKIDVDMDESISNIKKKVCKFAMSALYSVDDEISNTELEKAVATVISAETVLISGFGGSSCTASDGYHKFFRISKKFICSTDMHIQTMTAGTLKQNDVLIAISNSGRTEALVDLCKLARSQGAKVIAITQSDSPIDHLANIHLSARDQDDTSLLVPMVARLRHLTILDILVTAVATRTYDDAQKRLTKTKNSLKKLKNKIGRVGLDLMA